MAVDFNDTHLKIIRHYGELRALDQTQLPRRGDWGRFYVGLGPKAALEFSNGMQKYFAEVGKLFKGLRNRIPDSAPNPFWPNYLFKSDAMWAIENSLTSFAKEKESHYAPWQKGNPLCNLDHFPTYDDPKRFTDKQAVRRYRLEKAPPHRRYSHEEDDILDSLTRTRGTTDPVKNHVNEKKYMYSKLKKNCQFLLEHLPSTDAAYSAIQYVYADAQTSSLKWKRRKD